MHEIENITLGTDTSKAPIIYHLVIVDQFIGIIMMTEPPASRTALVDTTEGTMNGERTLL